LKPSMPIHKIEILFEYLNIQFQTLQRVESKIRHIHNFIYLGLFIYFCSTGV
jgi:hypothetical protein